MKISKKRKAIVALAFIPMAYTLGTQGMIFFNALFARGSWTFNVAHIVIGLVCCGIFVVAKDWNFDTGEWRNG